MGEEGEGDFKKPHRSRHSGRKAEKKKAKNPHVQELTAKQRNPKAFAINAPISAERSFRRSQEIKRKKEHIPVVDRSPLEPPPIIVALVGPPKVGKTSVLRNLLKSYTRQPLSEIRGPVTLVSGKKRRITFIECNNDINCMIDIAKVADLVLLLIDASFGFEMEIFEFLNICQVHGMPRIMGVLTHLDVIKKTKKVQRTKKLLKHRFWKEVYPGAKLFYLSKILPSGNYMKNEVKNLARFISVMKFRPLTWQSSHSYVLADRMEDVTQSEEIQLNPKVDRNVCIYGYMRGIPMNKNCFVHIPGCGDYSVSEISFLPDPCPRPEQIKKRSLDDKERTLYAPFSGVGGIVFDKDAIYVDMPARQPKRDEQEAEMVHNLLESKETVDVKLAHSKVQIFSDAPPIMAQDFQESDVSESDDEAEGDEVGSPQYETVVDPVSGRKRRKVIFPEEELKGTASVERRNKAKSSSDTSGIKSDDDDSNESGSDEDEEEYDFNDVDEDELAKRISGKEQPTEEFQGDLRYKKTLSEEEKKVRAKISGIMETLELKKGETEDWSDSSDSDSEVERDSDEGEATTDEGGRGLPWEERIGRLDGGEGEESSSGEEEEEQASDDEEFLEDTDLNWKSNLAEKAAKAFVERQADNTNLWKLVYGAAGSETRQQRAEEGSEEEADELGGFYRAVGRSQEEKVRTKDTLNALDCSKFPSQQIRDWSLESNIDSIRDCFVTGKWGEAEDAEELLKLDDLSESEEELYGDFEDLETGEKFNAKKTEKEEGGDAVSKEALLEKKRKLKEKFDKEYDKEGDDDGDTYFDELKNQAKEQTELNRALFEGVDDSLRVEIEGFRAGLYVRMEIANMPCEFVDNFDPTYPLIVGSVQPGEQNIGYVKIRVKKHRWYKKILKTRDPLILSMGWRRFQTVCVYSKLEDNMRHRMLKYTPQHVYCMAHFWGPLTKAGTGVLGLVNSTNPEQVEPEFRIAATGVVVDTNQTTVVTKKLKLKGVPIKVYKKTAFISDMFTSALEVAKFEGAKIKTVSGIRGQIKKPIHKPEGAFRATFEDKIQMSDIVFCRTWCKYEVPQFYASMTTLLLGPGQKNAWRGMKTLGQLKRERAIRNLAQEDSMYTSIKRAKKRFRPLVIPRGLEKELPYKLKAHRQNHQAQSSSKQALLPFMKQVQKVVIRDKHESQVASLLDKIKTTYIEKREKMKKEMKERRLELKKRKLAEKMKEVRKQKELKKRIYRTLGKMEGDKLQGKHKKKGNKRGKD